MGHGSGLIDSLLKIKIIADYFYSILRCDSRSDFFVGVNVICRCDFLEKKVFCDCRFAD